MTARKHKDAEAKAPQTESTKTEISRTLIAARAYDLWQRRGCPLGDGQQDWFSAKAELESETRAASPVVIRAA